MISNSLPKSYRNERDRVETLARAKAKWASLSAEEKARHGALRRAWRLANPDKVKGYKKAWKEKNLEKYYAMHRASKRRISLSAEGAINRRLREGIKAALKYGERIGGIERRLGYTAADLVAHIERQFLPGMTWENRGQYGWHIDHIVPLKHFKFTSMDDAEFRAAWSLSNLRPVWWRENLTKGGKRLTLL
jgi:hypothetical protein